MGFVDLYFWVLISKARLCKSLSPTTKNIPKKHMPNGSSDIYFHRSIMGYWEKFLVEHKIFNIFLNIFMNVF